MFDSVLMTPADIKLELKRSLKRQKEEERRTRIFNVKARMIGVDVAALNKQIEEKRQSKEALKKEDDKYLDLMKTQDRFLREMEAKVDKEKREQVMEIQEFRQNYQTKEKRREYDLNDPDSLKKQLPSREGDDDPRLTISSMQRFEGERGDADVRLQQEQLKAWLAQQVQEKEREKETERIRDEQARQLARGMDERILEIARMEDEARRRLARATIDYNRLQAKEKAFRLQEKEKRELEDTKMHMMNVMNSEMLAEVDNGSQSHLDPNKVTNSTYKGNGERGLKEVKAYQLKQIEEDKLRREEDRRREAEWVRYNAVTDQIRAEQEASREDERRRVQQALIEENRKIAAMQTAHKKYLEESIYKVAAPSAAFFMQFNTSTR